jgi:protein-serine/threonine kinase
MGIGYDKSCDWWSLGVILFESIYGFPPFCSKTQQQSKQKILNWKKALVFPEEPHCSQECKDLMSRLICEPFKRLGSSAVKGNVEYEDSATGIVKRMLDEGDAADIKGHPWFRGIDWLNIRQKRAPFIPDLADLTDASYFDQVDEQEIQRMMDGSMDQGDKGHLPTPSYQQQAFEGFSFINPSMLP